MIKSTSSLQDIVTRNAGSPTSVHVSFSYGGDGSARCNRPKP
jgi:hypothetical protein